MHEQQSVRPAAPRRIRGDGRKRTFAILSIAAFLLLNLGLATGRVAIVVVLSSLTSGVTVVLARFLDRSLWRGTNGCAPTRTFRTLCGRSSKHGGPFPGRQSSATKLS